MNATPTPAPEAPGPRRPTRLAAIAAALACLGTAGYLALQAGDARHVRRANELGASGQPGAALQEARRVSRAPASTRALLVEAYALRDLGRRRAASAAFARLAARDPSNWVVHRDWAVLLVTLGMRAGARQEMERALALNPRMTVPRAFWRLPRAVAAR